MDDHVSRIRKENNSTLLSKAAMKNNVIVAAMKTEVIVTTM